MTPQWPFAAWAGFLIAALALFLLIAFALYLPWYALAAYGALVVATVVLRRVHWPQWVRHSLLLAAFAGVLIMLVKSSSIYPVLVLALALGAVLSFWVSHRRERDARERDAFKRERTSP